jgi:hypothetical protein
MFWATPQAAMQEARALNPLVEAPPTALNPSGTRRWAVMYNDSPPGYFIADFSRIQNTPRPIPTSTDAEFDV